MGMYDDIKCSYDIGKLTNRECQSKEFDYYGGYHVLLLGRSQWSSMDSRL